MPIFAAGIAIQQLLEIVDPVISRMVGDKDKNMVLGVISILAGMAVSFGTGLRVLEPLGIQGIDLFDGLVTALIISAGTEGFNSVLKFLGYAKEGKKSDSIALKAWVGKDPQARDLLLKTDRRQRR